MTLKNLTKFIILLILSVSLFFAFNFVADKQKVLASTNNNKLNVEVLKPRPVDAVMDMFCF